MAETLAQIGAQLRRVRIQAGLTQQDVAFRANVSRQLVGRIENGLNGEVSAYVAVASVLDHRFTVVQEVPLNDHELAALELIDKLQAPPAGRS
ncbi:Transcriptional regulator, contains XRE-family HTH domain [Mycolicibacterium fluoranthenivorans]|uniref:Transcriptional regulator, contains XRE-family HTH domain n=1 Tax=Mycolicibacterium fluoranthenivorans TaxID=258505 RepID=A0A1G4WX75_9MYCO|nr:Transcriptional regulator, contains XRE-family HTH domain [Mycolicibacterium fluoranthenivorans]